MSDNVADISNSINPHIQSSDGDWPKVSTVNNNETKEAKDPWVHRSDGMKCRTCMFYVTKNSSNKIEIGRCRATAPSMKGFPAVYPNDWCGNHKIDEEKLLCG